MTRGEFAKRLGGVATAGAAGPATVIAERDPQKFMAAFANAAAAGGNVFLANPNWGESERAQLGAFVNDSASDEHGWLMIPTGGTSGRLKFARHDEATLGAAVEGFTRHFGLKQVNAMGVLPLHHVSGLMAWLRCALTGGEFLGLDWKAVEAGKFPTPSAPPDGWVISLVPTQLERLLGNERAVAWLKSFRIIFLGGAPAWPTLLEAASAARLPISLGYGMTESAAMITALKPEEFLSGVRSNGSPLPHGRVSLGEGDRIELAGPSLFRGYFPEFREAAGFPTQDRGRIDERGHLHVLGRIDAVIITGGEKVEPSELEAVLRGTGQFSDVVVLGLPDHRWGQQVVAVYPGNIHPNFHQVIVATNRLADYKRPKRFIPLAGPWPVNAQGKVNRAELTTRVLAQLKERR